MALTCDTKLEILESGRVWRYARHDLDTLLWSAEQQRWIFKVPGNGLQFDPDLSTYSADHIEEVHEKSALEFANITPGRPIVFEGTISELSQLGLTAEHTPDDSELGCAHVSFHRGSELNKLQRRVLNIDIALLMHEVTDTITLARPDGA